MIDWTLPKSLVSHLRCWRWWCWQWWCWCWSCWCWSCYTSTLYLEWPDASTTSVSASPKSPKVIVITMSGYLVIILITMMMKTWLFWTWRSLGLSYWLSYWLSFIINESGFLGKSNYLGLLFYVLTVMMKKDIIPISFCLISSASETKTSSQCDLTKKLYSTA